LPNTLAEIARDAGFRDIAFQYEPIAAAFDYEAGIGGEELVLVADIGGGTSDFSLVRLSPERARHIDRRDDILANGGVHIGGTDFDRALSLASVMPMLGLGSQLRNGKAMPSGQYFDLASWHTINLVYTRKAWSIVMDNYRDAADTAKLDRLIRLIRERAGHWLAIQVEAAKIALSAEAQTVVDLARIAPDTTLAITRETFDESIAKLVDKTATTVHGMLNTAGVKAEAVDTILFTGAPAACRCYASNSRNCCRARAAWKATCSAVSVRDSRWTRCASSAERAAAAHRYQGSRSLPTSCIGVCSCAWCTRLRPLRFAV
jgi:hypothetical chaperone protein